MATFRCKNCTAILPSEGGECPSCGHSIEQVEILEAFQKKAEAISVSTLQNLENRNYEVLGLVFGTSSKQAFWGLSTQADRLSRAYGAALNNLKYEAAMIGADEVLGVNFSLNNSTGSAASLGAGSSEAVMLLGTAIRYKKR